MSSTSESPESVDILLRLVPDAPATVLGHLRSHPDFASAADRTGYCLLHAAASYDAIPLMKALVAEFGVDTNQADDEKETALFYAETIAVVKCLVEELQADISIKNVDGMTAEDHAVECSMEGPEWPQIAEYLERARTGGRVEAAPAPVTPSGDIGDALIAVPGEETRSDSVERRPPPLPPNVRINMGTMEELPVEGEGAPDPEFRNRIEALAARDDFQSEAGQTELRDLIRDAVGGLASSVDEKDSRRRTE